MALMAAARRIRAWLGRRGAEFRLSLRTTVAGLLTFALAEFFGLAQGYWAVLTAVIVVQASVGGSLQASIDRLIGTLCGAAYAALIGISIPHAEPVARGAVLVAAVAPLALLAALKASFRIAPVTAVIVLLGSTLSQDGPLASAVGRVSEISLGCIVGLAVSLLVLPARAHGLVLKTAGRSLVLLADMLTTLTLGGSQTAARSEVARFNDRLRAVLQKLDAVGKDAEHERRSRLTEAPDPEPLIRTLRRLRSDLIIIARTAVAPMAEPCRKILEAPLAEITAATGNFLRAAGQALAAGRAPPAPGAAFDALDGYAAAVEEMRRSGLTLALPGEEVGRIFALGFAFDQLRGDLQDLANRAGELAGSGDRPEEKSA